MPILYKLTNDEGFPPPVYDDTCERPISDRTDERPISDRREAWRTVGRSEEGLTQAEVAEATGVAQSVISRMWNRFFDTRSAGRRPGQG
ncbi:hypothetical protein NPIL_701321 [Nephila pilipes]|uniref:HTH cro/C1-type domain-containing protein n=1 Tax=Nephila pilipes TaxID=299642 RepID=A0A8X6MXD9_NEPPI|nr:hypothetical protein NPIL_701321 [Nephila pilipes]